ncbi:proton-conducting transporter membrane subunit [Micromonospora costi]|uniref:NADH-quinone oxidoreductase subunit L n=1 Tax=Micromonospora costi TaxID=1530042 RepID=A0A3A9ZXC0_9ACTN|nr:proton-conducting transporter membrane subunit [Micromonospora costi]RKN53008.1 NADH-quinone oxidoreductase subunit L [Micromonospora costi]
MSLGQVALWSLVALPAGAGALLALTWRADRVAVPVSMAVAALSVGLSLLVAVERPSVAVAFVANAPFGLAVDALAALTLPTLTVVSLLVLLAATGQIRHAQARFHGLMLLFVASVAVTVTATTLPTLLFAWEIMGAASYALIGFWWRDTDRVSAGLTAFLTTRATDLGLYVAAAAALAGGAGLALTDLPAAVTGWRHVIAAGILAAALGKAAQLPVSFWLSRAMAGPSPVSALLHSAAMVAMGGYLLLRVQPLLAATGWAGPVAMWVGALTALLIGAVAVAQRDVKQLLAASTCAQLGFVVMAAGAGTVAGGAAHLVAHAATKALLFLGAGAWLSTLGTQQLAELRGVVGRWRLVGWSATVGALALAGIPPLSLWATKDAVLTGVLRHSPVLYVVGLAASLLSAAYAGKLLMVIWRRPTADRDGDRERAPQRAITRLEQAPLVVLALASASAGVLALPPAAAMLARAVDERDAVSASLLELAASAALAVAVVLLVARRPVPEPRWALRWLGLQNAAHALVARPTVRLADLLARFDDRVLDRAVERVAAASAHAARRAAVLDDRWVDGTVERFAAGMRRLGQLARRPQSGQVHQYYRQAIVVLVVAVVVLVAAG